MLFSARFIRFRERALTRRNLFGVAVAAAALAVAVIQFIPSPALKIPAQLPLDQRAAHRLLNFEGIDNFRDLGGYPGLDERPVKWGKLFRSGTFAAASDRDLAGLRALRLETLIDFRAGAEMAGEPDRLPQPPGFTVVDIPVLDDGNATLVGDIMARIDSGNFEGFDPDRLMVQAYRQFAADFTPQFRQFIHTVLAADGAAVAWHCSAGKDRSGFAAAILLRILGVSQDTVMRDYMASGRSALSARANQLLVLRLLKGKEAAEGVAGLLGVEEAWLEASFAAIDATWGSFDRYVAEGLQLSDADIGRLQNNLLE
jgi:protein-tyrosine phosphatase